MSKVTSNEKEFVDGLFTDEPVALILDEHEPSDFELNDMEAHMEDYIEEEAETSKYNFTSYELEMIERMMDVLNREPKNPLDFTNFEDEAISISDSEYSDSFDFSEVDNYSYDEELNFDN